MAARAATPPLRAAPAPLWHQPEAHWLREQPHPQWRRAAATAQWPQRPHVRERSRVTTRGKTCSDTASGNDKPHTRKELEARQAAFSTLPLRYARFWVYRWRPGVISGLDTWREVPIYSRHAVRAEWHGPPRWGSKSPILSVELLGLLDPLRHLTYALCVSLPTSLRPHRSKLTPSGHHAFVFPFPCSWSVSVSVVCLVLRPDTLRWCCSAPSWCIACRCLLAGTARAVVLPGLAQASSRPASGPCLAGLL